MEDLTEEQVIEIITNMYPDEDIKEYLQDFQEIKQEHKLNNLETILLIKKLIPEGDTEEGMEAPVTPEAPQGRFAGIKGMIRGK